MQASSCSMPCRWQGWERVRGGGCCRGKALDWARWLAGGHSTGHSNMALSANWGTAGRHTMPRAAARPICINSWKHLAAGGGIWEDGVGLVCEVRAQAVHGCLQMDRAAQAAVQGMRGRASHFQREQQGCQWWRARGWGCRTDTRRQHSVAHLSMRGGCTSVAKCEGCSSLPSSDSRTACRSCLSPSAAMQAACLLLLLLRLGAALPCSASSSWPTRAVRPPSRDICRESAVGAGGGWGYIAQ